MTNQPQTKIHLTFLALLLLFSLTLIFLHSELIHHHQIDEQITNSDFCDLVSNTVHSNQDAIQKVDLNLEIEAFFEVEFSKETTYCYSKIFSERVPTKVPLTLLLQTYLI